jgi:hypothetical protein
MYREQNALQIKESSFAKEKAEGPQFLLRVLIMQVL